MTNFFDGRSGIGVHQKRKVFELRNQYTLTDESSLKERLLSTLRRPFGPAPSGVESVSRWRMRP